MVKYLIVVILFHSLAWSQDQAGGVYGSGARTLLSATNIHKKCQPFGFRENLNWLMNQSPVRSSHTDNDPLALRLLQKGPSAPLPLIQNECVEAALSNVTAGDPLSKGQRFRRNRFFRCDSNHKAFDNQDEPCMSLEYRNLVHNSFEVATKCLKEFVSGSKNIAIQNSWVEEYFKMLSTESGMHLNVASSDFTDGFDRGTVGVAQLKAEYIADFKKRTLPSLKEFLRQPHVSAGCKRIADEVLTEKNINGLYSSRNRGRNETIYRVNTCAMIDINRNQPLLNLLIGFGHLKTYAESVENGIFNHSLHRSAFKSLSEQEIANLKIKMVSWSYNLGAVGLVSQIQALLDTQYANKVVRNTSEFITAVQARSKSNYLQALDTRYKKVLNGRKSCRSD